MSRDLSIDEPFTIGQESVTNVYGFVSWHMLRPEIMS